MQVQGMTGHQHTHLVLPIVVRRHQDPTAYREQCAVPGCTEPSHATVGALVLGQLWCPELCREHARQLWEVG